MAQQEATKRVAMKLPTRTVDALQLAVARDYPAATRKGQVNMSTVVVDLVNKHLIEAKGY